MSPRIALLLLALALLAPRPAQAHGLWGHIHVTGWAIENLPPGELRDFFSDPEVFNAALWGSAFPDSGYFPQAGDLEARTRDYGEHAHWEPYVQDYIAWMIANDPPPWTTLESRQRVAFLLGNAAHGLQDELFDSLMLAQTAENDGGGQDATDPGTDGFLVEDGHIRFIPTRFIPMDTVLAVMDGRPASADDIDTANDIMEFTYVNANGPTIAAGFADQYRDVIPWTRAHYLDPDLPGSLVSEITPTARYMEAIWERLHGRFTDDQVVIHTFPEDPRRLRSYQAGTADSWVTFVFGVSVEMGSASFQWTDDAGSPVAFRLEGTRWGNRWPRLMRLMPEVDLTPGGFFEVTLQPGFTRIDDPERPAGEGHVHRFQSSCMDGMLDICPDLGEIPGPRIDGMVSEPPEDAGGGDAGDDAGSDAGGEAADDAGQGGDAEDAGGAGADEDPRSPSEGADEDAGAASGSGGGCATSPRTVPAGAALWVLGLLLSRSRRVHRGA